MAVPRSLYWFVARFQPDANAGAVVLPHDRCHIHVDAIKGFAGKSYGRAIGGNRRCIGAIFA